MLYMVMRNVYECVEVGMQLDMVCGVYLRVWPGCMCSVLQCVCVGVVHV